MIVSILSDHVTEVGQETTYNLGNLLAPFWNGLGSVFGKGPLALAFQAMYLPFFLSAQSFDQFQKAEKQIL